MFDSILVLCTGNVCRSPIAERLLRNALKNKKIDSAGLGALIDNPADPAAVKVAAKHGLSLDGHMGRKFSSSMAREYDLILVMDKEHLAKISQVAPEARGKTMLLGHWLNQAEIPDPYKKSDEAFDYVYKIIEKSCLYWVEKLID
ncbi:arsenate reductase/protein-tyrosine-phosphatase family protein [Pluralibacter gergoviae]|nr:protein tyrosine phosphatase [Pluralibacter gergoviae]EKW9964772.1 protein tyrosine phosphatase [Pluralibacter gergoviae]